MLFYVNTATVFTYIWAVNVKMCHPAFYYRNNLPTVLQLTHKVTLLFGVLCGQYLFRDLQKSNYLAKHCMPGLHKHGQFKISRWAEHCRRPTENHCSLLHSEQFWPAATKSWIKPVNKINDSSVSVINYTHIYPRYAEYHIMQKSRAVSTTYSQRQLSTTSFCC